MLHWDLKYGNIQGGFINLEFHTIPHAFGPYFDNAWHNIKITLLHHHQQYQLHMWYDDINAILIPSEIQQNFSYGGYIWSLLTGKYTNVHHNWQPIMERSLRFILIQTFLFLFTPHSPIYIWQWHLLLYIWIRSPHGPEIILSDDRDSVSIASDELMLDSNYD